MDNTTTATECPTFCSSHHEPGTCSGNHSTAPATSGRLVDIWPIHRHGDPEPVWVVELTGPEGEPVSWVELTGAQARKLIAAVGSTLAE